jgi:hypothetical protein
MFDLLISVCLYLCLQMKSSENPVFYGSGQFPRGTESSNTARKRLQAAFEGSDLRRRFPDPYSCFAEPVNAFYRLRVYGLH